MPRPVPFRLPAAVLLALAAAGCSQMPSSGPTRKEVQEIADSPSSLIQIVDVDDRVARRLLTQRQSRTFAETLGPLPAPAPQVGRGDTLEVNIWEAPPATLFGAGSIDPKAPSTSRPTTLPEQMVDAEGYINVPFAGRVKAVGQTTQWLETEIARRLKGKANQPEVLVRQTRTSSSSVTVVGEVANSLRMPLTASGERLLDALAAAGGVRQPVNKTTLQVTRGAEFHAMPLDAVIRDPRQNVPLRGGDVVTALVQPLSFTVLGATGKNDEIPFESQGISLAQALARAGGLSDSRSDQKGVFVFRFEPQGALDWPRQPVQTTLEGLVPVVYRVDLNNPTSLFLIRNFAMMDKDLVFVANAPAAELQKFLNLVFSVVYPLSTTINLTR